MKKRLAQSILLAVALALLIVGVSAAFTLRSEDTSQQVGMELIYRATCTPSPLTTSVPMPYINVTRQQYDKALARWRSQGIREYSMTVEYTVFNSQLMGVWDLHVQTDNAGERVVNASRNKENSPIGGNFLTVESMFETIKNKLDYKSETGLYWMVSFDPTIGYPSSIAWNTQAGVQITDLQGSKRVQSFEVLKRITPGILPAETMTVP
jgi:hypothetical protein